LQDLQLQSLDPIPKGLFALANGARAQLVLARELSPLAGRGSMPIVRTCKTSVLQLSAGFEGLYTALLALDLRVGAREEKGDVGAYFVAQGGLGGGERGLGDEFVVLLTAKVVKILYR
jgi:hypothetical protein